MGVRRWIELVLLVLVVAGIGVVALDFAVWELRGRPVGTVLVTRMAVAPLKGNRVEYYPDGQEEERCSVSVLPWAGSGACWRVRAKPLVFEQ